MSRTSQNAVPSLRNAVEILSRRGAWTPIFALFVLALGCLYLRYALLIDIDHDEVEHAHVAFKMLSGDLPYRDFYQNHWPAYWFLDMQFVRLFPFSVDAILAARIANIIALALCWLLGLRLLASIRGGQTWLGLALYTWAIIAMAYHVAFHEARPDPLMTLLATAGLCLIPLRGSVRPVRAAFLGLLFGLSLSVSTKMAPLALVVPTLVLIHCARDRRLAPATALVPYAAGALAALLPTAWWLFHNELFEPFVFDVFGLNLALSTPLIFALGFLLFPVYAPAALGTLAHLGTYLRQSERDSNAPLILALAMLSGIILALIARHGGMYNFQILVVPVAVGFTALVLALGSRIRGSGSRLLLIAALVGYPSLHVAGPLVNFRQEPHKIPQSDLQMIMDLAAPGERACIAFSPAHPVFCRDVSGLSNGWDISFAERIEDPRQLQRFRSIWRDGIERTLDGQADIILRKEPQDIWERAAQAGMITPEELHALDELRGDYEVRQIGRRELWVRQYDR